MTRFGTVAIAMAAAFTVLSCTAPADQPVRSEREAKELAEALSGRVAGPAERCIPNYRATQMEIIDDWTILFRDGRTVYVQTPRGGCPGLRSGRYTLVTRPFGVNQLCDGDLNHTIDLHTNMQGPACVFGPFLPYTKPKS